VKLLSLKDKTLAFPKGNLPSPTAHSVAGTDPWPLEAMQVEENGKQKCNVCHYPQAMEYPDMAATKIAPPKPRVAHQERGITCASCHLTPDGKIRGPYAVDAPHATIKDDRTTTSIACAYCHSAGERIIGKQTQTFLEWREDFSKPGLGTQQCQDCHAEDDAEVGGKLRCSGASLGKALVDRGALLPTDRERFDIGHRSDGSGDAAIGVPPNEYRCWAFRADGIKP
jgi:Cytochrome c3